MTTPVTCTVLWLINFSHSTFASSHLKKLTASQLDQYDDIINRPSNDWQLYYWMTGREETPAHYDNEVMDMLKSHARNDQLETRCYQPDLWTFRWVDITALIMNSQIFSVQLNFGCHKHLVPVQSQLDALNLDYTVQASLIRVIFSY